MSARWSEEFADEAGYLTFEQSRTTPRISPDHNAADEDHLQMGQLSSNLDIWLRDDLFWTLKGYVNTFDDKRFVRFSANVSQQERLSEELQYGGITSLTYRPEIPWLNDFSLETGFDIQQQENKSDRFLTDNQIRTRRTRDQEFDFRVFGGYMLAVIEPFEWLKLTPGFRADKVEGNFTNLIDGSKAPINKFGTIWQPKIGAVITPLEGYSFYGNWGRTFQVPVGSGSFLVPPRVANLDPSINTGWEVGIKLAPTDWLDGRVAYWQQTATDEWARDLNNPNNDSINVGKTKRQGVDAQVNIRPIEQVYLWASFSLQEAIIKTSGANRGNKIDHTPTYLFSGGIDYQPIEQFTASLWTTGQGSYFVEQTNTLGEFGEYALLNLNLDYHILPEVALQFQVKNLTDTFWEYAWHDGTQTLHSPGDGRSFFGAVQVNFDI